MDQQVGVHGAFGVDPDHRPQSRWLARRGGQGVEGPADLGRRAAPSWCPGSRTREANLAAATWIGQPQTTSTTDEALARNLAEVESGSHQFTRTAAGVVAASAQSTSSLARLSRARSVVSRRPTLSNDASRIASLSIRGPWPAVLRGACRPWSSRWPEDPRPPPGATSRPHRPTAVTWHGAPRRGHSDSRRGRVAQRRGVASVSPRHHPVRRADPRS